MKALYFVGIESVKSDCNLVCIAGYFFLISAKFAYLINASLD